MKDLLSYVLCARFLTTMGHLLVLLLLVLTYKSNVEVGLSDTASSSDRQNEEDKCLVSASVSADGAASWAFTYYHISAVPMLCD